jgi:hypothetical protein
MRIHPKNLLLSFFRFGTSLLNSLLSVFCSKHNDASNVFEFPPYLGRATHYCRGIEIHKRIRFPTESSFYALAARPFWYDCTCLTSFCDQLFLWSRVHCDRSPRGSKHVHYSDWCSSRYYEWKAHSRVNSTVGPLCSRNSIFYLFTLISNQKTSLHRFLWANVLFSWRWSRRRPATLP